LKSLAYLNRYLWKYKKWLLTGVLFIVITNVLNILSPYLVRIAFDVTFADIAVFPYFKQSGHAIAFKKEIIRVAAGFGLLILIVNVVRGFFMFLMRQTIIVASRKIEFDLKNDLYQHYQSMDMAFFRRNFTGDLMSRLSEDVSKVRMYLGPAIMYFVNLVFTFIVVLAMMLAVNPTLTLYVLLPLPVLSLSIYWVSKIINRKSDKIQQKLSVLTSFVQESMAGSRVLKAFSAQAIFAQLFAQHTEDYRKVSMSLAMVNALFMPLMMFLVGLSTLLTIYLGGVGVINGSVTFGNIAEFVIYINLLTWPVASLGWVTAIVQSAEASQARINAFLNEKPEIVSGHIPIQQLQHHITCDQVSFQYTPSKKVLHNINLHIPKGTTVGIVGPTGAGKSTFLHLLARAYDVTEGQISFDGVNIKDLRLNDMRSLLSYVTQEVHLFSESIYDNIVFGAPETDMITMEMVENAAKIAEVHHHIVALPQGYHTILGERGVNLSGGQKQRISLARAILRNPQLILLDDSLSAVDHTTEKNILLNLKKDLHHRTAFVVSHRLSVVREADIILVMEKGAITGSGNHHDLMKSNDYYRRLYHKQHQQNVNEVS
jgi:ATP-binding cassette, subfamily B, multidrug efflux pump